MSNPLSSVKNPNDQIVSELFRSINTIRQSKNLNIFSRDKLSDHTLSTLFRGKKDLPSNNEIESKLITNGCIFQEKTIHKISANLQETDNIQIILKNYNLLLQNDFSNNNSPLLSNNIYTHLGLYIKTLNNSYSIIFIFSKKMMSLDLVIGCNDGNVLIGTILKPDHYIEGVLVKELDSARSVSFGPKNIRYNPETKKFYIMLLNSICSTINNSLRVLKCVYQLSVSNIAYGASNALGRNVNFKGTNIGENQLISFYNEDKHQIFNGTVNEFITNQGFAISNTVGSATKNKLDIKSKILAYNMNKNNNKDNITILTPKKRNSAGLGTIPEEINELNKSFMGSLGANFGGLSPIPIRALSPGGNNMKINDVMNLNNNLHVSPRNVNGSYNINAISNPFETKNKIPNDSGQINVVNNDFSFVGNNNNNLVNNQLNNNNLNNVMSNNVNNNPINTLNNNNNLNSLNNNNLGNLNNNNSNNLQFNQNKILDSLNKIQSMNNLVNTISGSLGNPFDPNNQANLTTNINTNNNLNTNLNGNLNSNNLNNNNNFINANGLNNNNNQMFNQLYQNNLNSNNFLSNNLNNNLNNNYGNNNIANNNLYSSNFNLNNNNLNMNNLINNNLNYINKNAFMAVSKNVTGYQIISRNIKYSSLIDIQNIGNQNMNNIPKLIINNDQNNLCINLYNINSRGTQNCQTTSKPKEDFMDDIQVIKQKYSLDINDQINFVNNNLPIIIEDFYGKKITLTMEILINTNKKIESINTDTTNNTIENEIIKEGKYLNIEFPYFKEIKNDSSKNNNYDNKLIESKSIIEKKYKNLCETYLTDEEQKEKYKYNPSFEQLYYSHDFSDIVIKLNFQTLQAHKVVLASSSKVFMDLIKVAENEFKNQKNKNPYYYNNNPQNTTNIIEILLPENFDFQIFNEIMRFIYCGTIKENLSLDTLRKMLIMSEKLKIIPLVKILLIKNLIPKINKDNAITLAMDACSRGGSNEETANCWEQLLNFSIDCIAKNSVDLIKTNYDKFMIMDLNLLSRCIKICMDNIVDIEQLSNLLQILVERTKINNIFELLNEENNRVKMCRCFDMQNINIDPLIEYFDSNNINKPLSFPLIDEDSICNNNISVNTANKSKSFSLFDFDKSNNKVDSHIDNKENNSENSNLNKKSNILPKNGNFTFSNNNNISNSNKKKENNNNLSLNINLNNNSKNQSNSKNIIDYDDEKYFQEIYNYLSPVTNTNIAENITNNISNHAFDFIFCIPENTNLENGVSIFSEKFTYRYHCWSLKIDINSKGELSFFLIERGCDNNCDNFLIKFNSIVFEFIIRDSNCEKSKQIFFSFIKNQHQIIGHKNFININQLTNKNTIHFILNIKRYSLHSGILQYLNENFNYIFLNKNNNLKKNQNLYLMKKQNYLKYIENYEQINPNDITPNLINNNNFMNMLFSQNNQINTFKNLNNIKLEYINMNSFDITYLLFNDDLPVDSENNVVGAIYLYCLQKEPKDIDNLLKGLRYEFINSKILFTLAREHEIIKNCPSFRKAFKCEVKRRIAKSENCEKKFQFFNTKIEIRKFIKRKNYNSNYWVEEGLNGMNISDEIIKFFLGKPHKEEYKEKLISLKKEIQEERKLNEERLQKFEYEKNQLINEKNMLLTEIQKLKNKAITNRGATNSIFNNYNNNCNSAVGENEQSYNELGEYLRNTPDVNNCIVF